VERVPEGYAVLGGGELAQPGELVLAPGRATARRPCTRPGPTLAWDGLSARLHAHVRARPAHPSTPRPLTLNVWEAVYFDHDLARLTALADRAAAVGVERFVLDDGWFLGRRDDTRGLGDWVVDPRVWPDGLHPWWTMCARLGLQFGLWFEPEMISLDSEVARAHPDWVLAAPGRLPRDYRHQHVIDLANPEAYAHVLGQLDALCTEYALDAIKWDHNRDLAEPVHAGRPGAHAQTAAVARLIDELRRRHPRCEIGVLCLRRGALGPGHPRPHRPDLGLRLHRSGGAPRPSSAGTGLLLAARAGRRARRGPGLAQPPPGRASCRSGLVTALFGHAGIEWDITTCSAGS